VLVLAAEKDLPGLGRCVGAVLAHCRNPVAGVWVVSARPPAGLPAEWVDETRCTPAPAEVGAFLRGLGRDASNASWYFQQLVKLGCFDVLPPGAPDRLLVVDADFVFVREQAFTDANGRCALPYGYPLSWRPGARRPRLPERHSALAAAARLVPGWAPVDAYSGMQHHMVFDRVVLAELARRVRAAHGRPLWEAFLATADARKWTGASEYVLYRHFAARFFPGRVRQRHVSAVEVVQGAEPGGFALAEVLAAARAVRGLDAVGCHRFLHYARRLATMDYIPDDLRPALADRPAPLWLRLAGGSLTLGPARRPLDLADPA
jgi:hypothetical protein